MGCDICSSAYIGLHRHVQILGELPEHIPNISRSQAIHIATRANMVNNNIIFEAEVALIYLTTYGNSWSGYVYEVLLREARSGEKRYTIMVDSTTGETIMLEFHYNPCIINLG